MLTLAQQELASAWSDVAAWAIHVLAREGLEGVAVAPLVRFPGAAQWIIRREALESDHRRRQLAAILAGTLATPPSGPLGGRVDAVDHDLLSELFEFEARRVLESAARSEAGPADATDDAQEPAESAAVVASLIDSAAHWADRRALRPRALEVLRRVVETAVAGEPWTNLERAAMVLARHGLREHRELFGRLHRVMVAGHDPGASAVARLLTGETDLIDDDERTRRDALRTALDYHVGGEARDLVARLVEAAERVEIGVTA